MKIIRIDSPINASHLQASLMADSAIRPDRRPLFLPEGEWACEIRPALRIDRLGKGISGAFASRYYSEVAFVNYLKAAKPVTDVTLDTMDDAIVAGSWIQADTVPAEVESDGVAATLDIDRAYVDRLLERLSERTTFKTGDIIILPDVLFAYTPVLNRHVRVTKTDDNSSLIDFTIK